MTRILFVCHGNICRSPMAEFIMKKLAADAGLEDEFEIESAATSYEEIWNGTGNPIYPPAQSKLRQHGIPFDKSKRARHIEKSDYSRFDLIIGMDHYNIRNMNSFFGGDPEGKFHLMLEYAGKSGRDVSDPWYTDDFDAAYEDILAGCKGLIERKGSGQK